MPDTYAVHYSEVALKGKNRHEFVRVLRRNIHKALGTDPTLAIEHKDGRFLLSTNEGPERVEDGLSKVFGIAWFARASIVRPTLPEIEKEVTSRAISGGNASFRISVRRSDKSFPMDSMEAERRLGAGVVRATGRRVNLSEPDESINVDVVRGKALVYSNRRRGLGGLPVGTAGRVLHLFSGGIDSPVAAWLLMKRGCTPVYLHFYLAPTVDYALQSKIMKLVGVLARYSGKVTIVFIPFAEYQLATSGAPGDLEPSLFRRFMRITAEALAPRLGAGAISTGDCLSQAASQTLWNLATFDHGSQLPILRPLLTYDKEEVINLARRIGTYELSIEEYRDCCSIVTRHPKTRAKEELISKFAERYDFNGLCESSMIRGTLATFNPADGSVKRTDLRGVEGMAPAALAPR